MSYLRELNVFIEEDGQKRPFPLVITTPEKTPGADDYFCSIHAPVLFKRDKSIHGVDAKQAEELAIKFVNDLLSGRRLIDENGKPLVFQ